jgi:hypothetical protein
MSSIAIYESAVSLKFKVVSPENVIEWISSDLYHDFIQYLRSLNKAEYDAEKKKLPGVTWSGVFKEGTRSKETLVSYSGLVCLDIDKLEESTLSLLKSQLKSDPYVRYCFVSPSGKGLKVIVEVNTKKENHRAAFLHLQKHYEDTYVIKVDSSGKDESRLCFVSHDTSPIINQSSTIFEVDVRYGEVITEYKEIYSGYNTVTDAKKKFDICVKWVERNKTYRDGEKNIFIHALACALNRVGVPQEQAIELIDSNLPTPDKIWYHSVRGAYYRAQDQFNTYPIKDIGSNEFVADEVYNFTDDVVKNDLMNIASELHKHGVNKYFIKDVVGKITSYYDQKKYIDINRANPSELVEETIRIVNELIKTTAAKDSLPYQSADEIANMIVNTDMNNSEIVSFPDIDRDGGGIRLGNFYGIIGLGETFKSILSQYICYINALRGIPSLYLNGEMSAYQFYERLCLMALGIDLRQELRNGTLSKETVADFINQMREKTGGNIHFVNGSGFNEKNILATLDSIEATTGKKVKILVIDGVTQMDWGGRDEITATIFNSMVCKEVAKKAYSGTGVAILGLLHVSGSIVKWKRNTGEMVRGGKKVLANMDAYFCTSRFIDPSTNELVNDEDVKFVDGKFYLRYVDKRSRFPEINIALDVARNLHLIADSIHPSNYEVKMKRR